MDAPHRIADLELWWLDGALYLETEGVGLLVDAPAGVHRALADRLPRTQAVALSSGRMRSVGGLLALFRALEVHRTLPFEVRFGLGEDRAPLLAEAYDRGWPDGVPVQLDGFMPGETFDTGPFSVTSVPVNHGERCRGPAPVRGAPGVAFRLEAGGATVAWVPGAGPGSPVRRACRDVDLAIVEVGVVPWPPTPERWRLSYDEAVQAADGAELWVVGDDGRLAPTRFEGEH